MNLKEILQNLVASGEKVILSDSDGEWEASDLLKKLSERVLARKAHLQHGMYIAEISESGYLGRVLFRVKKQT